MFGICEAIRWSHLPAPGGLYDQHPVLLDQWLHIFSRRAEKQKEEQEREKVKNANKGRKDPRF